MTSSSSQQRAGIGINRIMRRLVSVHTQANRSAKRRKKTSEGSDALVMTVDGNGCLRDILLLYQFVCGLKKLSSFLTSDNASEAPCLRARVFDQLSLSSHIQNLEGLEKLVERTLDIDAVVASAGSNNTKNADSSKAGAAVWRFRKHQRYQVNPSFHPELLRLREQLKNVDAQIALIATETAKSIGMTGRNRAKLKLEHSPVYGICFRVTRKDEKQYRKQLCDKDLAGFYKFSTQKDGMRFTVSRLQKQAQMHMNLTNLYDSAQTRVVLAAVNAAASYAAVIASAAHTVAEIDSLCAFAHVATAAARPYVRPNVSSSHNMGNTGVNAGEDNADSRSRFFRISAGRHPCLEQVHGVEFVANDLDLSEGTARCVIITGPNMGGKSTYTRMVGQIAVLSQIGAFVPADSVEMTVIDSIFARVGASDHQVCTVGFCYLLYFYFIFLCTFYVRVLTRPLFFIYFY